MYFNLITLSGIFNSGVYGSNPLFHYNSWIKKKRKKKDKIKGGF